MYVYSIKMSNNILINFVFIVNIYTQVKSIYFHAFTYKQKYTTKKCTKKKGQVLRSKHGNTE